jgi:4-hydroxy-tetrahydrodipicolinate synthase
MLTGCFTALVTPFKNGAIDNHGLDRLIAYQIENGITGILAVGTTGESPSLSWEEHNAVIEAVARGVKGKCICIAGTGSNNTREALAATEHAARLGVEAALLVDPYYNGPSSLEIRREYIEPVAAAFPQLDIIPYVIPGRTGAQLLPEDLAIAHKKHPNVRTVKEATADIDNMRWTRECCGSDMTILSGDDGMTFGMMTDPVVKAGGAISVVSNIVPGAVARMVSAVREGDTAEAETLKTALAPLFGIVMVKTQEESPWGEVLFRARNPLPVKALMNILGMPAGECRRPLGKLTKKALKTVMTAIQTVHRENPEILQPIEAFFGVDIGERINRSSQWEELAYGDYS